MLLGSTLSIHKIWNYSGAKVFLWTLQKIFLWPPTSIMPFWNFIVFWVTDPGKWQVCEFGIRIPSKITWKVNAWKEKVQNFAKNNIASRNFSKTFAKQLCSQRTSKLCQEQQIWIYMKIIYRGEPKDINI